MKKIDFTKTGKMPFTQERLAYMQTSYKELSEGIAAISGHTSGPYIVSGCETSVVLVGGTIYNYSTGNGWVFYNGELLHVNSSIAYSVDISVDGIYFVINDVNSSLTYHDGSINEVILDKFVTIGALPIGTVEDSTKFKFDSLKPFGREKEWTHSALSGVSVGLVNGDIYYKKDFVTNTLLIRGSLTTTAFTAFAGHPSPLYYLMDTLPPAYCPKNVAHFDGIVTDGTLFALDFTTFWIKRLPCKIESDGKIYVRWERSMALSGSYTIEFNERISLD